MVSHLRTKSKAINAMPKGRKKFAAVKWLRGLLRKARLRSDRVKKMARLVTQMENVKNDIHLVARMPDGKKKKKAVRLLNMELLHAQSRAEKLEAADLIRNSKHEAQEYFHKEHKLHKTVRAIPKTVSPKKEKSDYSETPRGYRKRTSCDHKRQTSRIEK